TRVPAPVVRPVGKTPNESLACDCSSGTEAMNSPACLILPQKPLVGVTTLLRACGLYGTYLLAGPYELFTFRNTRGTTRPSWARLAFGALPSRASGRAQGICHRRQMSARTGAAQLWPRCAAQALAMVGLRQCRLHQESENLADRCSGGDPGAGRDTLNRSD